MCMGTGVGRFNWAWIGDVLDIVRVIRARNGVVSADLMLSENVCSQV